MGIRTLQPVYAEVDPDTLANIVVTEDVAHGGAKFLSALSPYTVDQAAESLEQLAHLHAATWMHTVGSSGWLAPRLFSYTVARGVADIRTNFESTIGVGVPESVRDADRLYSAYEAVASDAAKATPWAVIHGDPHIGNLFLNATGRPTFLDWQLVQRGPWYLDVGYHLASSLSVEQRRQAEEELVEHYLDHLAGSGIERPAPMSSGKACDGASSTGSIFGPSPSRSTRPSPPRCSSGWAPPSMIMPRSRKYDR